MTTAPTLPPTGTDDEPRSDGPAGDVAAARRRALRHEFLELLVLRQRAVLTGVVGVLVLGLLLTVLAPGLVPSTAGVGLVVGLVALAAGVGLGFVVHRQDPVLRAPGQARWDGGSVLAWVRSLDEQDVAPAVTVLRGRTAGVGRRRLLLVDGGAGATAAAMALGGRAADEGLRTLVVDLTDERTEPGMAVVGDGTVKLFDAVDVVEGRKLATIGAGRRRADAVTATARLLERPSRDLDLVLVVAPTDPVLRRQLVSDVDRIVLTVAAGTRRRSAVRDMLDDLGNGTPAELLLVGGHLTAAATRDGGPDDEVETGGADADAAPSGPPPQVKVITTSSSVAVAPPSAPPAEAPPAARAAGLTAAPPAGPPDAAVDADATGTGTGTGTDADATDTGRGRAAAAGVVLGGTAVALARDADDAGGTDGADEPIGAAEASADADAGPDAPSGPTAVSAVPVDDGAPADDPSTDLSSAAPPAGTVVEDPTPGDAATEDVDTGIAASVDEEAGGSVPDAVASEDAATDADVPVAAAAAVEVPDDSLGDQGADEPSSLVPEEDVPSGAPDEVDDPVAVDDDVVELDDVEVADVSAAADAGPDVGPDVEPVSPSFRSFRAEDVEADADVAADGEDVGEHVAANGTHVPAGAEDVAADGEDVAAHADDPDATAEVVAGGDVVDDADDEDHIRTAMTLEFLATDEWEEVR